MVCPSLYAFPYFYNFGDAVGADIIKKIAPGVQFSKTSEDLLVTIGSVMHIMHKTNKRKQSMKYKRFILWGTGSNPTIQAPPSGKNMEIHALRGPLTRKFLESHDIHVPLGIPYGDPALLIPHLFGTPARRVKYKQCIIPHFNDVEEIKLKTPQLYKIYPHEDWKVVWNKISQCKFVVSSSLHGIIFADSQRIPARWLSLQGSSRSEGRFKYCDYFCGSRNTTEMDCMDNTGPFRSASTVEEAIKIGPHPELQYDHSRLLLSFPHMMLRDCDTSRVHNLSMLKYS